MVCVPQSEAQLLQTANTAAAEGVGEAPAGIGPLRPDEDTMATCQVFDMTSRSHDRSKLSIFVRSGTTVRQLYDQIENVLGHSVESFEITLQGTGANKDSITLSRECFDRPINDVGINFSPNARNSLVLSDFKYPRSPRGRTLKMASPQEIAAAVRVAANSTISSKPPETIEANPDEFWQHRQEIACVEPPPPPPPPPPPLPPLIEKSGVVAGQCTQQKTDSDNAPHSPNLSSLDILPDESNKPSSSDPTSSKSYFNFADFGGTKEETKEATYEPSSNVLLLLNIRSSCPSEDQKIEDKLDNKLESRPEATYVGLVNQAMTCYLNSLLQALFMTPEFRNALYKWEFDGKDSAKSIPFQLQKLFLNLQTSLKPSVETTELTRSFGWDSSEAWQQHDVQELCRVMFDALEHKFKRTDQADLINSLYEGKMIDYVKCLECGTEKQREDKFLDIPLPVRPFGSTIAYSSVVEALRAFVQPETLDGNNQYHCERCNKKCDAHKGLKFTKFPYLLTLHLKRFDFDYSTLHRIKLNDKVIFPELLELTSFIQTSSETGSPSGVAPGSCEETSGIKYDDGSTTDSGSALDEEPSVAPEQSTPSTSQQPSTSSAIPLTGDHEDDEGIDVGGCAGSASAGTLENNEKNARRSLEKGPYSYELFVIMIHSGSATGGHYYAYIKDFSSGQWFCFNDQSVTRITNDDIRKTYGGGLSRTYYSGTYSSSTNAYMLMYRQIDKDRNCEAMRQEQFPNHIKILLQNMREQEEREKADKERQLEVCRIKVYAYHPTSGQLVDTKLYCTSDVTLAEATQRAHKQLGLEGLVLVERCRLVLYDRIQDCVEGSFDGKDEESLAEELRATGQFKCELLLEMKRGDDPWVPHSPGSILVRTYIVDLKTEEIEGPHMVRANLSNTLLEFQQAVWSSFPEHFGLVEPNHILVALERYGKSAKPLIDSTKTLKAETYFSSNNVFVTLKSEDLDGKDESAQSSSSRLVTLITRFENTITLHLSLPDIDKDILEELSIPSLEQHTAALQGGVDGDSNAQSDEDDQKQIALQKSEKSDTEEPREAVACVSGHKQEHAPCRTHVECTSSTLDSLVDSGTSTGTGDQSASEDSSLTDSERTLVGEKENLLAQLSSSSDEASPFVMDPANATASQVLRQTCSTTPGGAAAATAAAPIAAPEEEGDGSLDSDDKEIIFNLEKMQSNAAVTVGNWDKCPNWSDDEGGESSGGHKKPPGTNYSYFKATPYEEDHNKMLKVQLDKRTSLPALKKNLEPFVGVPMDYFKIYRSFSTSDEFEFSGYNASYRDGEKLCIRLGKALRKGEFRGKVFQLCPGATESTKFLFDWVLAKGILVADAKREILDELKKKHSVDIPYNRCRLRKKNWKNPGQVYYDHLMFEDSMVVVPNWELFVQEVPNESVILRAPGAPLPELVLFVRRWRPSSLQLGPFKEVELESTAGEELRGKLARLSEEEEEAPISPENIEIAKGQGSFPCDISVLAVNSDLEWSQPNISLNSWPLNIFEDGHVILYRDCTEAVKKLTRQERMEINDRSEFSRVTRIGSSTAISNYSPRKERALKIYLDATPPKSRIDESSSPGDTFHS